MTVRNRTLLATEAALFVLTSAAIFGMHRLFVDGTYRSSLLIQALAAHVVVAVLRRRGVPLPLAAVVTAAAALLLLSWEHYFDTTAWFLPTPDTFTVSAEDLRAAWQVSHDVEAPVPVKTGFLLVGGAAVWAAAYVADWAAFRASASFEALLPSAVVFLFAAAMGAPGGRVVSAAFYAAAAMAFVLLHRTLAQERGSTWAASHRSRGRWSLLATGSALIGITVVAGAVAGPNLPGADAEPILGWRDLGGDDDTRVVVSPMVDIQTRLVDQPEVELFTVRSDEPAYWRLTSLDEFDGRIWRSGYGTDDADGELPRAFQSGARAETVDQTFTIERLAAVWLPAAYEPVQIDPGGSEVEWDEESSTLIVDRRLESSDGFSYQVVSEVPRWTDEELREAPDTVPEEIAQRYLQLPDDLDPAVVALAEQLTAGQPTPFDKAMALQTHLRTEFTYNLEVGRGHSSDALRTFLFETREGYCEQFAGAFAALARAVDLPSRVAVGFSPGIPDPADPTLHHVSGKHAHAWVELYFDGYGWVTFDPTPTRAPPRADEWLGVPPQQSAPDGAPEPAPSPVPGPAQIPRGGPVAGGQLELDFGATEDGSPGDLPGDDEGESLWARMWRYWARPVAALGAAYAVLVPVATTAREMERRRRAKAPADRLRYAWQRATNRAAETQVELPPWLTVSETAARLADTLPAARAPIQLLAASMERLVYGEIEPTPDEADDADEAGASIVDEVRRREPIIRRIARYFDARRLWRDRSRHAWRTAQLPVLSAPR